MPPCRGGGRQERPAGPPDAGRPGPGAGAAGRPGAPARRRPLRAEGGHRRRLPTGSGAATGAALARGPAHDHGAACRTPRQGGARPPRPEPATAPSAQRQSARGREGNRPANSDVGAGATEQRSGGEARRASGDPRRRRYHTGAGGSANTDLRAAAEHPGGDGPPSRYRGEADERRHSGGENSQANWQVTGGESPLGRRSSHSTTHREPCVSAGDDTDEASVAVRAGTGMSAERERIQSAEILRRVEGNTGCTDMARSSRALRRLRTEARMYVIYRDLGDLRVALAGRRQGRKGKARSRNRR